VRREKSQEAVAVGRRSVENRRASVGKQGDSGVLFVGFVGGWGVLEQHKGEFRRGGDIPGMAIIKWGTGSNLV